MKYKTGRPKKRFGQHFLVDESIAERIVASAELTEGDTVLEIGPGRGILTERLLDRGCRVNAVEIDRDLAASIRARFGGHDGFHCIEGDILSQNLVALFGDLPERIKVVSNIPYNITAPIIELLAVSRTVVAEAVLMVQKEVAARLLALPGKKDYGLLTLNLALCAEGEKVMDVPPESFEPPPEVMSTVIRLFFKRNYRYPLSDGKVFRALTGAAFRQRRKMVRNTIVPFLVSMGLDREKAAEIMAESGIEPTVRPETIDVARFAELTNRCVEATTHRVSSEGPS